MMLGPTLDEYAPSDTNHGITTLLRDQIANLKSVGADLFSLIHDLHTVAAQGATCQDAQPTREFLTPLAVGQIAKDTNLKEEVVRRVVERLLAAPHDNAEPVGKVG